MIFVSSWDDGHPLDRRIAELHAQRGLHATFFVPLSNCEGRPVMCSTDLRGIDTEGFEIGSHTAEHRYLDVLPASEIRRQVEVGKCGIEQTLGHTVTGFCYPGGRRPPNAAALMQSIGISYARTVENLRTDRNFSAFDVPTTLQFYPHSWKVLLRNTIREPQQMVRKLSLVVRQARTGHSLSAMASLVEMLADEDVVLHLWGHSWEIDHLGAWNDLNYVLDAAQACATQTLTVGQLCQSVGLQ